MLSSGNYQRKDIRELSEAAFKGTYKKPKNESKNRNFISLNQSLFKFLKISFFFMAFAGVLISCGPDATQKKIAVQADSLLINVRCIKTVTGLITNNFLLPGQKRAQYKMEYINETWPDTITKEQAAKLVNLQKVGIGFEKLMDISKGLQEQSVQQLEQLKKLNNEINSGTSNNENLLQYLTFESKCADTLNRVLDTLVKKSIELSCKSHSL